MESSIDREQRAEPRETCRICKGAAVTRVPVRALKPQTVRRYIFGQAQTSREDVALCGVCSLLHCEETFEGDGPVRIAKEEREEDRPARRRGEIPRGNGPAGYDYACALLRMLEKSGYHIYLRSDGRQIILSHEDGLDRQTRGQVERYRREITEAIIERLWQNGAG